MLVYLQGTLVTPNIKTSTKSTGKSLSKLGSNLLVVSTLTSTASILVSLRRSKEFNCQEVLTLVIIIMINTSISKATLVVLKPWTKQLASTEELDSQLTTLITSRDRMLIQCGGAEQVIFILNFNDYFFFARIRNSYFMNWLHYLQFQLICTNF